MVWFEVLFFRAFISGFISQSIDDRVREIFFVFSLCCHPNGIFVGIDTFFGIEEAVKSTFIIRYKEDNNPKDDDDKNKGTLFVETLLRNSIMWP